MSNLLKRVFTIFMTIVFVQIAFEVGEEEKSFIVSPFKFFGIAFVLSIVSGLISHWIDKRKKEAKD